MIRHILLHCQLKREGGNVVDHGSMPVQHQPRNDFDCFRRQTSAPSTFNFKCRINLTKLQRCWQSLELILSKEVRGSKRSVEI